MNRFNFLTAFLLAPLAFAQSKINKSQIKYNTNVGTVPLQDVKLLGNYGASEFLEIRLGDGLTTQMKTVGTESFIEIVATASPILIPAEQTFVATRVSNNRYSVAETIDANRKLKVFYNGLFQTPVVDYTRDGASAVIFTTPIPDSSTITFVFSGI